jgi:hypothetical protein
MFRRRPASKVIVNERFPFYHFRFTAASRAPIMYTLITFNDECRTGFNPFAEWEGDKMIS